MSTIHLTLQGKGGVGKSFVAALIAQFLRETRPDAPLRIIDTDPVNATLSNYAAFDVLHLKLQENGSTRINERHFDQLMEMLLTEEATFVIDNGAASFVPLTNYLIENDAVNLLVDAGRHVVVHPVITGGQGLLDTLNGFSRLAEQMPAAVTLLVWLNEYFGDIAMDGKPFEQMAVYKKFKDRVSALVTIPRQSEDTFGRDVHEMLTRKLTFEQALADPDFTIMSRQRLKMTQRRLFDQLALTLPAPAG